MRRAVTLPAFTAASINDALDAQIDYLHALSWV
jgi:hypothetical protein